MRVLVVEDDVRMAASIRRALRGVNVIGDIANTSRGACAMLADAPYDVVVLDVVLPDSDGFATCRRLRSAGDWTPIILLTPRAGIDDRIRGLNAGADDYLSKPIRMEELAAALRRCRPHVAPQPPALAGESGEGAQVRPAPEPQGQRAIAGVLDPPALERLVETIGDDRSLLMTLIDTFLSDAPRLVEAARRGLEHGQTDEVRRAAHTLKSNGATFGASSLSELSRQLEALAR